MILFSCLNDYSLALFFENVLFLLVFNRNRESFSGLSIRFSFVF